MKKILSCIILFCLVFMFFPAKDNSAEALTYKIEKNNSVYSLIEKESKKEILPPKYNKIRKIKYNKQRLYVAEMQNYITLFSPDGLYSDFLEKYYQSNKYNSAVKFNNYPKNGIIRYKQNKKFGLIAVRNDILHITKPVYEKIVFPDEHSIAAKFLDISFAPEEQIYLYLNYSTGKYIFQNAKQIFENSSEYQYFKQIVQQANINENISSGNNILNVGYSGNKYSMGTYIINNSAKTYLNYDIIYPDILYSDYNKHFKFKNYPENALLKADRHLYIFEDGEKKEILLPCSDFYIPENIINKLTGLNISFQNADNIIAKNGNWGIIDKNNKINVPFIYDVIYPLNSNYEEKFYCEEASLNCKITLEYIDKSNSKDLFLVKKGYGWGIIDNKNNIIVPFEYKKAPNDNELADLKSEINKKITSDDNKAARQQAKSEIPLFILDMLLLPLWILLPYPFSGYVHIDY